MIMITIAMMIMIVIADFGTFVCTKLKIINKIKSNIGSFICIVKKQVSAFALITSDDNDNNSNNDNDNNNFIMKVDLFSYINMERPLG